MPKNSNHKLQTLVILTSLVLTPVVTHAQYGGTTIQSNTSSQSSSSAPVFSSSTTGDKTTISIEKGKKNDVVNLLITNPTGGVVAVKFTLLSDLTNAKIEVSKIASSALREGLIGNIIAGFSLSSQTYLLIS